LIVQQIAAAQADTPIVAVVEDDSAESNGRRAPPPHPNPSPIGRGQGEGGPSSTTERVTRPIDTAAAHTAPDDGFAHPDSEWPVLDLALAELAAEWGLAV
jgi:hypothetical protein